MTTWWDIWHDKPNSAGAKEDILIRNDMVQNTFLQVDVDKPKTTVDTKLLYRYKVVLQTKNTGKQKLKTQEESELDEL